MWRWEDVDLLPGISVADDDGYWVDVTLGAAPAATSSTSDRTLPSACGGEDPPPGAESSGS